MADTPPEDDGPGIVIPVGPPAPVVTELSRLQDEWERAKSAGDTEAAAVLLAQAAVEYVEQAVGPVGDGLGGGLVPLKGKAPRGKDWTSRGMGRVGSPVSGPEVFEAFRLAGMEGADGIGVVCGSGLLVIDIDDWDAVPEAMWEILMTGSVASSRKNVADRRAHIGWRVGGEVYTQTMSGFDSLGGEKWSAAGVGELRSGGGHIRIWGGGVGSDVAARDPGWFLGLPMGPPELLDRLVVKTAAPAGGPAHEGEFYPSDLWDWLDRHTLERVEDVCGVDASDHNLANELSFFDEEIHERGTPKYSAALRISLKVAVDVAIEAIGGREGYDGLLEHYRQAGLAAGDWDERTRVSAYVRMWSGAVRQILDGSRDDMVRSALARRIGNPLVKWREGLGEGEWEPRVDRETGEILDRDPAEPELAGEDRFVPVVAMSPEVARESVEREVRRLLPVDDDGFMPSEQLLGDDFWESRGVLDFIRRWAWTRQGWPDAVLMGLLAGLGAALPLQLVIDPSKATPGPLSLFVLGIDQSGAGKTRNQTLAMKLLREFTGDFGPVALGKVMDLPIGTAEGILGKFFQKRDTTELAAEKERIREDVAKRDSLSDEERAEIEKVALADITKYVRRLDGVIIMADESKNLIEMDSLGGVGFATMLLSAWSGKGNILPTYKNSADLPQFKPLSYRISMNAAIQTGLAYKLLGAEQVDSGFAQRLVLYTLNNNWAAFEAWQEQLVSEQRAAGREVVGSVAVAGELAVEEQKDWVDLELAGAGGGGIGGDRAWNMPDWSRVKGLTTTTDLEVGGELWTMQIAADCGYREARLEDARVRFKERAGDPMDAHMLFNQLRLAGLLAVLDCGWKGAGRSDVTIQARDWELAGKIVDCTRANRSWLGRVAEQSERRVQNELAKAQAIRESALVLQEDELSEEGFVTDLLAHMAKAHNPESPRYKGDICKASCWFYAGQSKKRKERLKFWRSKGYFQTASESAAEGDEEVAEPAWFPIEKVPGVVRLRYLPRGSDGGWPVVGAVWYTQMPVTGGDTGIEVHPEDEVEV